MRSSDQWLIAVTKLVRLNAPAALQETIAMIQRDAFDAGARAMLDEIGNRMREVPDGSGFGPLADAVYYDWFKDSDPLNEPLQAQIKALEGRP